MVTIAEAVATLSKADLARIHHQFDLGTVAFAKVPNHEGLYIGVHMHQLPHMEQVVIEGRWSLCRKLIG